jgi:hypothetical protein
MTVTIAVATRQAIDVGMANISAGKQVRDLLDGTTRTDSALITVTAETKTLVVTDHGSLVVLDRAGGITITLPEANTTNEGWSCDFVVKTAFTGTMSIDASRTADLYYGCIDLCVSNSATSKAFIPDASNDDKLVADLDTKGRLAGGTFRIRLGGANIICINGQLIGSGTIVTPFA